METIVIDSRDELPDVAEKIIERLRTDSVAAFYGTMGAGKTTLIREIVSQMGVQDNVTSPTFALVNQYLAHGSEPIYHFDFYRIEKPEEAFDIGFEEYIDSGDICLIEWPEKIEGLIPADHLKITITPNPHDDNSRTITIE